ncbi:MAG: hypothetical protein ABSC94_11745 [Polyangiaceae bacterium]
MGPRRLVRALLAPSASVMVACAMTPPQADGGPQACATNADCRGGQVCRVAGGTGFCGNCVQGTNFAVAAGPYCLETGWGTNLGTGGHEGDNCPIGNEGCVVAGACTQLLRCDIGDSVGLYACPPNYQCSFEQCVSSANAGGLPCPPGSSYLPTSSSCGSLVYLEDRVGEAGTCVLYAPPCDRDAGPQSCPVILEEDQPVTDGYVSGPVEQVCLHDALNDNGDVCTPLRTCTGAADCTDGLFATCYDVDPQTGVPSGTCVDTTGSDSGLDATMDEGR